MSIYYARLPDIKAALSGSSSLSTTVDAELLRLADRVARSFDEELGRRFYTEAATAYYNGSGHSLLHLAVAAREAFRADVQTVTTCKQDENADGTFERTLTENTDFWLARPLNGAYRKLEITTYNARAVSVFQKGQRTVEIVGTFGVPGMTEAVGTAAEAIDDSETAIDVLLSSLYANGDTIKVDSEQMLVTAVTDAAQDTITVTRGVNGTTAAAHNNGSTIYRLLAPKPVQQYLIQEIARWWREQQTGSGGAPAGMTTGLGQNYRVNYAVVKGLSDLYRIPGGLLMAVRVTLSGPVFDKGMRDGSIKLELKQELEYLAARGEAMVKTRIMPGYGYRSGAYYRSIRGLVVYDDMAVVRSSVGRDVNLAKKANALEGRFGFLRKSRAQLRTAIRKERLAAAIAEKLND